MPTCKEPRFLPIVHFSCWNCASVINHSVGAWGLENLKHELDFQEAFQIRKKDKNAANFDFVTLTLRHVIKRIRTWRYSEKKIHQS